jgi:hypothetical protein
MMVRGRAMASRANQADKRPKPLLPADEDDDDGDGGGSGRHGCSAEGRNRKTSSNDNNDPAAIRIPNIFTGTIPLVVKAAKPAMVVSVEKTQGSQID